jgi:hypothetical protein
MNIKLVRISLFFLLVIALLGTLMRGAVYIQIPLSYVHMLHSHSHTAFQGWIYTAMILIIVKLFLTNRQIQKGRYSLQFKFTCIVVLGILISFALQGYGLYSIIFSSLFQILNYWFIFTLLRDLKKNPICPDMHTAKPQKTQVQVSPLFIKTSMMLGLLSTLAPWFIGILSAKGLAETESYQSFIFFFLHFQYNGWFLFASLGIFFKWLESDGEKYNYQKAKLFYYLFAAAVIPAWALSLLGMSYSRYILIPAVIAASLQLLSLMPFFQSITDVYKRWQSKSIWVRVFLVSSLAAFCIKICLQFHEYAFFNRSVIIAYLHLSLIGVITFFFLSVMIHFQWLRVHLFTKAGCILLSVGFISSEALLASSGVGVLYEPLGLLIFSILMALGVLLLLAGTFIKSPEPAVF